MAAELVPAVDAGPAASASDGAGARQQGAGSGVVPPQSGAAARQKPPSGPVVPGRVTLAAQRVRLALYSQGASLGSVVSALLCTSMTQAST